MENKYAQLKPHNWRYAFWTLLLVSIYPLLVSDLETEGNSFMIFYALVMIFGLSVHYIMFIYYHGFYPILGQYGLKFMNIHFSKRNMEIKYEDIHEVLVVRKWHKPFVRFLMVRVVCKDGRSFNAGLLTDTRLGDDLCSDLTDKGITVDKRF